jgi:CubicO group peptidase (beta-lactamase class C family)
MSTYNIPGASLGVTKNGKLVYAKGFGLSDKSANTPVTTESRFRLGSLSKTFTGIAVMKLVQDGKLSLDDKVFGDGGILENDFGTPPYSVNVADMQLRHLLNHTSGSWGLNTGGEVIDNNPAYTHKQFFDWLIDNRPNPKEPGTFYDYSNTGYSLLGRIIEKVSGKPYIDFIKEDLMAPLDATQTDIGATTEAETKSKEVKYYGQGNDASFVYNMSFLRRDASGGLISTATDLLKLITAVDGFPSRPDMLDAPTITELTRVPSGLTNNSDYACGIAIWSAQHLWYNYGSMPGIRSGFMRHDNGMCIALLLNSRVDPSSGETAFAQAMQNLMLDIVNNEQYSWQDIDQF